MLGILMSLVLDEEPDKAKIQNPQNTPVQKFLSRTINHVVVGSKNLKSREKKFLPHFNRKKVK